MNVLLETMLNTWPARRLLGWRCRRPAAHLEALTHRPRAAQDAEGANAAKMMKMHLDEKTFR